MLNSFNSRNFGISHAGIVERRMAKQILNYCTESIFHKSLAKLSFMIFVICITKNHPNLLGQPVFEGSRCPAAMGGTCICAY